MGAILIKPSGHTDAKALKKLTGDILDLFQQLRRHDWVVDSVDEDHRLVDAAEVVDAGNL